MATSTPTVNWAQRPGSVFVTIDVKDCKEPKIDLQEKKLSFSGVDGAGKSYAFDLELFKEIDVAESKINNRRVIELLLAKKEEESWTSLSTTKKLSYVKIDWNKWVDSDDEGEDFDTAGMEDMGGGMGGGMGGMGGGMPGMPGMGGMDFSKMMGGMGGGGMPGMGGDGGMGGMDMEALMKQMGGMGGGGMPGMGGDDDDDSDDEDLPDLDAPVGGEDGEGAEEPTESKPVIEVDTPAGEAVGA